MHNYGASNRYIQEPLVSSIRSTFGQAVCLVIETCQGWSTKQGADTRKGGEHKI